MKIKFNRMLALHAMEHGDGSGEGTLFHQCFVEMNVSVLGKCILCCTVYRRRS